MKPVMDFPDRGKIIIKPSIVKEVVEQTKYVISQLHSFSKWYEFVIVCILITLIVTRNNWVGASLVLAVFFYGYQTINIKQQRTRRK